MSFFSPANLRNPLLMAYLCRCLTGIPIAGEILSVNDGDYWGLIVFTGICYALGLICFTAARVLKVGWSLRAVY